jgi:Protein of unknown function (DUF1648)
MNRNLYRTLMALLWLAPVVAAARYRQLWDQLPARMASHFDGAGHANGWMPREESLSYTLGFMAFVLAVFTVVLYLIQRRYSLTRFSWALLAFFHVEIWTLVYMLDSILTYNLDGTPPAIDPLLVVTPVGAVALIAIGLSEKRGSEFPGAEVIVEEMHSGGSFSFLLLLPLLGIAAMPLLVPNTATRLAAVALGIIFVAAFAMAWDGFHYYFTRHGVEIRTLGFRLKSVPLMQIKSYAVGSWSPARGYGIRGIGNRKAYVWGNRGVRLEMYDGEIFLGHSDPDRIVHDLNVIKRYQSS